MDFFCPKEATFLPRKSTPFRLVCDIKRDTFFFHPAIYSFSFDFSTTVSFFLHFDSEQIIDWRLACLHSCRRQLCCWFFSRRLLLLRVIFRVSSDDFSMKSILCVYWTRNILAQSFYSETRFNSMQSDYNVHAIRDAIQVFACLIGKYGTCVVQQNSLISAELTNCQLFSQWN